MQPLVGTAQLGLPISGCTCPAAHAVHEACPICGCAKFTGHARHWAMAAPADALNLPAGHSAQDAGEAVPCVAKKLPMPHVVTSICGATTIAAASAGGGVAKATVRHVLDVGDDHVGGLDAGEQ